MNIRALGGLCWLLVGGPGLAPAAEPSLSGIFLRVDGDVTITPAGEKPARLIRPAVPLQRIELGDRVFVPAGKKAVLLCSTERLTVLTGTVSTEWTLRTESCARGKLLPAGAYRNLTAETGTLRSAGKTQVWLRDTRTDPSTASVPIVLSPRNTVTRDLRPTVRWTEVPEALEYEIRWQEIGVKVKTIPAADAVCAPGQGIWQGFRVCSAPFPPGKKLDAGLTAFLKVGARLGRFGAPRMEDTAVWVRSLAPEDAVALDQRLEDLEKLSVEEPIRILLRAAALGDRGMVGEMLELYQEALSHDDLAALWVASGDALLVQEAWEIAELQYRRALRGNPLPEVRAAASRGLGQVEYFRGRFDEARSLFTTACQLFESQGLAGDAAEMKEAISACAARDAADGRARPRPSPPPTKS